MRFAVVPVPISSSHAPQDPLDARGSNRKAGEIVTVPWKDADSAYRRKGCIYLYAGPQRAFLLPDGQADAPDEAVWQAVARGLGEEKCRPAGTRK